MTTTPVTTATDGRWALEQSRARSQKARQVLTDAQRRVEDIEARLASTTAKTSADGNALRSAVEEVKRLKKELKDGEKERRKLVTARKQAQSALAKAEEKARKREAKYNRAVLADMIQRQKEQDLGSAATPAAPAPSGQDAQAAPNGAAAPPLPASGDGEPPRATAGDVAQPAPKPATPRRTSTASRSRTPRP
ncbi:MAG: hypothetical protein ACXV0U_03440 [Kineosporiaceae bacterium]